MFKDVYIYLEKLTIVYIFSRFPTAENILKRKAEQAEKEARGEVIENKEFGYFFLFMF